MKSGIFSAWPAPSRAARAIALGVSLTVAFTLTLGLTLALVGFPAAALQAADMQSPIGLWKTVDDKTGKPRALVRIYLQDGKYFGRIEQSCTPSRRGFRRPA